MTGSRKSPSSPALSEHDAQLLADAGFESDPTSATAARVDRDVRMPNLVQNSLSIADAATRLGVTGARIRQRIAEGTLWAFSAGRNRLLPAAQFTGAGAVPHHPALSGPVDTAAHQLGYVVT
ncbi:hypothetical protein [Rhodococcus spelaei]|uniref:hypothetical protein n=1 Tax=Rhodococcus spelaei TaxID=2546320 RepID=UPI001FE4B567|nr:hypothetical protein [Rhodococcus spelaei]